MNYIKLLCEACFLTLMATLFLSNSAMSEESQPKSYYIVMTVTAYCPCEKCCSIEFSDGKTAIGRDAYKTKGVAVDRSKIPLNSHLDIPGYGNWIVADDVGGAIRGNRLDVRFPTHREALKWGVKKLRVRVWPSK